MTLCNPLASIAAEWLA